MVRIVSAMLVLLVLGFVVAAPAPLPKSIRKTESSTLQERRINRYLGMKLAPLPNPAVTKNQPLLNGGLLVTEVRGDGPTAKVGLRVGDVLVGLHSWEIRSLDNVTFVLSHTQFATFSPLKFYILRGDQLHRGYLQPTE